MCHYLDPQGERHKFIADQMLGRLSKWLRLMGYDTLYFKSIDDIELIRIARKQGRILLTRDTGLMRRRIVKSRVRAIFIEDDLLDNQLRQLIRELNLDTERLSPPLCVECNSPLEEVPRERARGQVPSYVYRTQDQFVACPVCGRYYWRGTHWQHVRKRMRTLLK